MSDAVFWSVFGFAVLCLIVWGILAMIDVEHGLPISWREQWEKLKKSFSNKRTEYIVDVNITSGKSVSFPFDWDVKVTRTDGTKMYSGNRKGYEKTQQIAFREAAKYARQMIDADLKSRKPVINKQITF